MAEETERNVRRRLRSPRSAAIAGIVYALLMITIMVLTTSVVKTGPEQMTREWLDSWSKTASLVITLVPFAGIAFMWFTGVIRDRLGEQEDQFFATLFFGSAIILVVLFFIWGAVFGALIAIRTMVGVGLADNIIYLFGFAFLDEIIGNYVLRIAGVYMTSICTLWIRTRVMPLWLSIITYALAMGFLVAAERIREARFIFPAWVLLMSIYILILNFRHTHDKESDKEASMGF